MPELELPNSVPSLVFKSYAVFISVSLPLHVQQHSTSSPLLSHSPPLQPTAAAVSSCPGDRWSSAGNSSSSLLLLGLQETPEGTKQSRGTCLLLLPSLLPPLSLLEPSSPYNPARAGQEWLWSYPCSWGSQRQWGQWQQQAGEGGGNGKGVDVLLST